VNDPRVLNNRRLLGAVGVALFVALVYALRGVLVPLFLAFLIAYALDPLVDRLERARVPRSAGAPVVMLALISIVFTTIFVGVPVVSDELSRAAERLPEQLDALHQRTDELLFQRFHYRLPATWGELLNKYGSQIPDKMPSASKMVDALFGTVNAIFFLLGTLIVPVFTLYLLMDFDRIIERAETLIPRRWAKTVTALSSEIHGTLGRYVRGQLITNLILAVLYATGLRLVGIRLAVPIGVMTGLLAFIPYVGLALGTTLATVMALLDWQSSGQVVGVLVVMTTVGTLDAMVITPRIVGGSVGLRPLEVLLTMAAAATLFGFLGVLLAVPLGAVLKILLGHATRAYLRSAFYREKAVDAGAAKG